MALEAVAKAYLPTRFGNFDIYVFRVDGREHVALVSTKTAEEPLVRIHSKCFTGDTLCSLRCDCREQLETSLSMISKKGGVLIYLDQEGRGIGLANKIKAYALQENGLDTVDANVELGFAPDLRDYAVAAEILNFFNIKKIKLITNNPHKSKSLEENGIEVTKLIKLKIKTNKFNKKYIETKKKKMGHL
jgi:GTP cyclohydrolase II